ncbi:GntR family transcriptional regulator [Streptomyces sp. RFCAC02]|uniref:GntR family transcriptional regulator n=1 Tax=Streptomyces sp. RFCAC02 TaxID=2499143 RepID=UPI0019CFAC78|nr:GntR family transcriptional regulator [Streptomyces sp. RFCAC02]
MAGTAYDRLRADIVAGTIPPGSHLGEVALAERYGVSRTPIREALRRLEQDGLVERIGRRMHVRLHRPEEILDIYDVRIILEEAAGRGAALRHTPLDIGLLTRAYEDMRAVAPHDHAEQARTNRVFHERLRNASHSPTLIDLLERLGDHLRRYPQTTLSHPGRWTAVLAETGALLEAVRERRADDAARIAAEHMTAARDIRLAMYTSDAPDGTRSGAAPEAGAAH